jgi:hypothetical protein
MTPDNLDPPTDPTPTNPPSEPVATPPNPTGPTNVEEVTQVFQNVVREGNRREQLLREELQRLRTESTKPVPPVDTRPAWERFAEDPEALIRRVVAEQTRELNQTAADIQRRTAYDTLINNAIAQNPGFGTLYQAAKSYVDNGMAGLQPTPENLAGVVRNVVGAIALGEIKVNYQVIIIQLQHLLLLLLRLMCQLHQIFLLVLRHYLIAEIKQLNFHEN